MSIELEQTIESKMHALKNLPVLPEASLRILDAVNTPNVAFDKLADELSSSPSLVARLLGLANSAYFSRGRNITDIRTAIFQVLGLEIVKSLTLAIIFNVQFDTRKCHAFDSEHFWLRSLTTAVTAQKLAVQTPQLQMFTPSAIYSGGLLLNIGLLVLGYLLPDELNGILLESRTTRLPIGPAIYRKMGQTHFQIGYFLANKWHLPPLYQVLLENFENTDYKGEEQDLLVLLRIADRLSSCTISREAFEPSEFESACERLKLPSDAVVALTEQLAETLPSMKKLATVMGS